MEFSRLLMWGERGLVASFFADMHMWARPADWSHLFDLISIGSEGRCSAPIVCWSARNSIMTS